MLLLNNCFTVHFRPQLEEERGMLCFGLSVWPHIQIGTCWVLTKWYGGCFLCIDSTWNKKLTRFCVRVIVFRGNVPLEKYGYEILSAYILNGSGTTSLKLGQPKEVIQQTVSLNVFSWSTHKYLSATMLPPQSALYFSVEAVVQFDT